MRRSPGTWTRLPRSCGSSSTARDPSPRCLRGARARVGAALDAARRSPHGRLRARRRGGHGRCCRRGPAQGGNGAARHRRDRNRRRRGSSRRVITIGPRATGERPYSGRRAQAPRSARRTRSGPRAAPPSTSRRTGTRPGARAAGARSAARRAQPTPRGKRGRRSWRRRRAGRRAWYATGSPGTTATTKAARTTLARLRTTSPATSPRRAIPMATSPPSIRAFGELWQLRQLRQLGGIRSGRGLGLVRFDSRRGSRALSALQDAERMSVVA